MMNLAPQFLRRAAKKTTSSAVKTQKKPKISHQELFQQIQLKAYELYEQRGCMHGLDLQDWLQAEQQVASKYVKDVI
jgi:hypothetical protein